MTDERGFKLKKSIPEQNGFTLDALNDYTNQRFGPEPEADPEPIGYDHNGTPLFENDLGIDMDSLMVGSVHSVESIGLPRFDRIVLYKRAETSE